VVKAVMKPSALRESENCSRSNGKVTCWPLLANRAASVPVRNGQTLGEVSLF
jgi:hypothetical protein